jgi:hypothetical protein
MKNDHKIVGSAVPGVPIEKRRRMLKRRIEEIAPYKMKNNQAIVESAVPGAPTGLEGSV